MKILFKNEIDFKDHTESIKANRDYDRRYVDVYPESYPCVVCYNSDSNYFGEHIIEAVDIIYPADFT